MTGKQVNFGNTRKQIMTVFISDTQTTQQIEREFDVLDNKKKL
jgi:hypothetical protein